MNPWTPLLLVGLLAVVMMFGGWLWQRARANAGIVDVLWTTGVGASAVLIAWLGDGNVTTRLVLAVCGGLWGLRLAMHLWRRVRGHDEDSRYANLREHWHGDQFKFFLLFEAQALLVVLFALPFLAVARNHDASPAWIALGIAIFVVSVAGETIADRQLARFRADPANAGKTCRAGLWRYSRHPNYFFEWLHWFTYCALAAGSPIAWLSLAGPIVMFVFLRWISGIPYTEKQALRSRGDDYREYQRTTSMLIPWFPKRA
jgi:steroid 5-alpha reductase family enzyme